MRTRLILIGVGASLLLIAIWFFVLWSPAGKNLDTAKADQLAAEQRAAVLTTRLAHLKKLEANVAVLDSDRALLSAAIPDTDRLDEFIHQVNERANKAGVSFVSVAPQQPSADTATPAAGAVPGGPIAIGLQIQVTGDYFKVLSFLEQMRAPDMRIVTIENFALSKSGEGGEMSASIGGRMFMNSAAVAAPTPASA